MEKVGCHACGRGSKWVCSGRLGKCWVLTVHAPGEAPVGTMASATCQVPAASQPACLPACLPCKCILESRPPSELPGWRDSPRPRHPPGLALQASGCHNYTPLQQQQQD